MTLDVGRNASPSLFKALHRFWGDPQQPGYLRLSFIQIAADLYEVGAVHAGYSTTLWYFLSNWDGAESTPVPRGPAYAQGFFVVRMLSELPLTR